MILSRAFWISLVVGVGLAGVLSACATKKEPAAAAAQCYWLSNEGAGWVARPDLTEPTMCFEMDSCSGGVGMSGGGCYKWARGAAAPAIPWTELGETPLTRDAPAAAAEASGAACYSNRNGDGWIRMSEREAQCFQRDTCSGGLGTEEGLCLKWAMGPDAPALPWSATLTNPTLAADIPPPKDIYEGGYEMTSDCPSTGCGTGPARLPVAAPVYAQPDARTRVVATLPAGECVNRESDKVLESPMRGVVLETKGPYVAGDVIYQTACFGEGECAVWRRGEFIEEGQVPIHEVVVRWDQEKPADPRAGYWVEVRRANGQRGWLRNPDDVETGCTMARR